MPVLRDVEPGDLDAFFEHQSAIVALKTESSASRRPQCVSNASLSRTGKTAIAAASGLATAALAELAEAIPDRPLHAWVATSNVGSIRVLEKCGFVEVERHAEHDDHAGRVIEEILFRLD